MKGIVFHLLQEAIVRSRGEEGWEDLLDEVGDSGVFTTLGNYPESRLAALIMAAAPKGSTPFEATRWFGRTAMPLLAEHYPAFFTPHTATRPFILTLNEIIHPEVRKLYAGADCPDFDFQNAPDGRLLMGYHSPRRLCALAQGFLEGAAAHYGETVTVEHQKCMHHGDPQCLMAVSFAAAAADVAAGSQA